MPRSRPVDRIATRVVAVAPAVQPGDLRAVSRPRTIQLFVNPQAGSWGRRKVAALRTAFEAAGATVLLTPSRGGRLNVADDADHVCAVGGDGTVRHVAAAVQRAGRPVSMSVYPLGTINLLARECGYSREPHAFVRRVLGAATHRRHHIALIDETPLIYCASVGPDSLTVDTLSPRLKRSIGRLAYGVALGKLLARWPRHQLRVTSGDRDIACEAVYIAKGRHFAGRWSFAPQAAVDRPLLHVVALSQARRIDFARFASALLSGRDLGRVRGVVRFTCSELSISSDGPAPVQADGDVVAHLPVHIALAPDTLDFA